MDRLSKALDLARKSHRHVSTAKRSSRPGKYEYTTTRVAEISPADLRRARIILPSDHESAQIDAYRLLRTRVLHKMEQNGWKTIGMTSAGSSEGKTLTAINLAISIAREGKYSVMLVDADLRRPAVARCFGLADEKGLAEYLSLDQQLEDLLVNPCMERLILLPGGRPQKGASENLSSVSMLNLVDEVKARYPNRIVIFDLPPVLVGDDVVKFTPQLDALLIVVQEGKTKREELAKALELVKDHNIIGTVLNCSEDLIQSYGYYRREKSAGKKDK